MSGEIIVEYPDKKRISLLNLNTTQIGIMQNDGKWTVTLVTKESLEKLKRGITERLEVFGITFSKFKNAMLVQNLLLVHIFKPDPEEVPDAE